jgi:hypothetical protein
MYVFRKRGKLTLTHVKLPFSPRSQEKSSESSRNSPLFLINTTGTYVVFSLAPGCRKCHNYFYDCSGSMGWEFHLTHNKQPGRI